MDIFSFFTLTGGLAFFLYGMHVMSEGLTKLAGGKLEVTLKKMTSNRMKSLLLGAGITIAIQSSSALTVMLVGLVNSGIMQLGQTIGVIMGSNVGTTLTAWILSLAGIKSDNIFMSLLKPANFSPIIALVGILLIMTAKKQKRRDVGSIMVGFSILMYGMQLMSDAVSPLADMPEFASLLTAFKNPILGVLVGAVFTGVIQSSAASVGILQALSLTGAISYGMAIPIIMGQNIGTCVTAVLSSFGVNRSAKRVAAVHISFNLIGTIICLVLFYSLHAVLHFAITDQPIDALGIAVCHTLFNVFTTVILLPFSKMLEKLAIILVKDDDKEDTYSFLDERLLQAPSFAVAECTNAVSDMGHLAKDTIILAIELFKNYSDSLAEVVEENELKLDKAEDKLGAFLVKAASENLSDKDSIRVAKLLHGIGDFERMGDHSVNLMECAMELHNKNEQFSAVAWQDLDVLLAAIDEILNITIAAYEKSDVALAAKVEPLEERIDIMIADMKSRHIDRLQRGECTLALGFAHSDFISNLERVSDHCSNLAIAVLNEAMGKYDAHEYAESIKSGGNEQFEAYFKEYSRKYALVEQDI